jgi:hypothetical protein
MRKLWKIKRFLDTPEEKPIMRLIVRRWLVLITAPLGLYLGTPVCGLAQNDQGGINPGVPSGTYVLHITGLTTPPGGTPGVTPLVPLAAVGRVTYFADGTTSGAATVSINAQFLTVTFKGTFTANGDGSFSETDTQVQTMAVLHFILYPTPNGNTLAIIQTDPGTIASGGDTRGS